VPAFHRAHCLLLLLLLLLLLQGPTLSVCGQVCKQREAAAQCITNCKALVKQLNGFIVTCQHGCH
jgi:hypothetical protein